MKILVCTDGSKHSVKVLEEAAIIAGKYDLNEVTVIHVYDVKLNVSGRADMEYNELEESNKGLGGKVLAEAERILAAKGIKVKSILKSGHPAQTIIKAANEGDFNLLVIGSRGLGGVRTFLLGSVSSAVLQEVKTNVLVIK